MKIQVRKDIVRAPMSSMHFQSGDLSFKISDLPAIPGLIAEAIRVLDDIGTSGSEIEAVILRDQAMAARVLRVVNSAAYGFSRRIETIRESVVLLGTRTLRGLAGAVLSSQFFADPIEGLVDPHRLWAHSLATSVWAMEIIDVKKAWHAQSAVMAALLHDVGIVLLCQYAPNRYRTVLEMSRDEGIHPVQAEQRELGTTHARVGATLCAKWLLPVGLTQLVNHHHSHDCPADDTLSVVMLADYLAHTEGHKPLEWSIDPFLPDGLLKSLDISDAEFGHLKRNRSRVDDRVTALVDAMTPVSGSSGSTEDT